MERREEMQLEIRDDVQLPWDKWAEIVDRLSPIAQDQIAQRNVELVEHSPSRKRIYIHVNPPDIEDIQEFTRIRDHAKQVAGELLESASAVLGERTTHRYVNTDAAWNPTCFECKSENGIEWHHVVPRTRGGLRTVPICDRCHTIITQEQDLSKEGKELWAAIDARVKGDQRFINRIAQRHGGVFVTDAQIERVFACLAFASRQLDLEVGMNADVEGFAAYRVQAGIRSILNSLPLPSTRAIRQEDRLTNSSALR
jgi:hypothetical protein